MAVETAFPGLSELRQALPKDNSSPLLSFEPFSLPATNQRKLTAPHQEGTVIPLALKPSKLSSHQKENTPNLDRVLETISFLAEKGALTRALEKHGALLFRDLPINDAEDFSKFAHAFGYQPHEFIGNVVYRPVLAPNVAPANEAGPTTTIGSHNESPSLPHAPAYVFFYGHKVAQKGGGETPIGSSLELFRLVNEEIPEFIKEVSEKGVLHTYTHKPEQQYKGGSTLAQAFGKEILPGDSEETKRKKIEAQIRRYNRDPSLTSWTWEDGGSITVKHILPAIRTQPGTGIPSLFTSLAALYDQQLRAFGTDRANAYKKPAYGDGMPIPTKYLDVILRITRETRVLHKWQRGDVLVFDNRIAQHGREPWEGDESDRRVFASLWDGELPGPYGDAPFATLSAAAPDVVI